LNANFLLRFDKVVRHKSKVRLLNSYKGLPVISEAEIIKVEPDSIVIQCDVQQIACLLIERHTYLQATELEGTTMASLLRLDPATKKAELGNFFQVDGDMSQREFVRVEPDEPISVMLQVNSRSSWVKGQLVDISVRGVGASLERILFNPRYHTVGTDLNVVFNLPIPTSSPQPPAKIGSSNQSSGPGDRFGRDELRGLKSTGMLAGPEAKRQAHGPTQRDPVLISGHGKVAYCFSEPPFTHYRLGISIEKNEVFQSVVRPYIATRQSDIIREFRGVNTMLAKKINP
jgi:hypothetical protein